MKFFKAASWCKRLDARLPPLGSQVRVSATPCGFRGGQNGVWVGFSRSFSHFPLPQISFHHFSILISSILFHFISPCDGASGIGRHPCHWLTYNIGASSHIIPRPDLVLDTSWGYFYLLFPVTKYQNYTEVWVLIKSLFIVHLLRENCPKLSIDLSTFQYLVNTILSMTIFLTLHLTIRESSTQGDSVHSETKALCPIRNFIILFILTTLWYDAIRKLLKHKGWSVEAWLV